MACRILFVSNMRDRDTICQFFMLHSSSWTLFKNIFKLKQTNPLIEKAYTLFNFENIENVENTILKDSPSVFSLLNNG